MASTPRGPRRRPIAGERRRARIGNALLEPGERAADRPATTECALDAEPARAADVDAPIRGESDARTDAGTEAPIDTGLDEEIPGEGAGNGAGESEPTTIGDRSVVADARDADRDEDHEGERDEDTRASGPAPRVPGWLRLVTTAVTVLAALALVTVGVLGYRALTAYRVSQARIEAVAAATEAATEVLSYDHRRLDADFAAAREHLTGAFAKKYAQTTRAVVRPTAEQTNAVVTAEVREASVVSAAPDRVIVLLFVDQTTVNDRADTPRRDRNRVRMTMELEGGDWLVSEVDAL